MSRAFTPGLLATKKIRVTKTRELPVQGEITVELGDKVESSDEVARAELPGDLYILRLPERMGLQPFEVLEGLKVNSGDSVEPGEVLCEKEVFFGLFATRFAAPEGGTIEFVAEQTAHVGLRMPPNKISLDAYIPGEVVEVKDGKSVTIASELSYVQGIFGVGGERQGEVALLDLSPDSDIEPQHFSPQLKGKVCIGGASPTIEGLRRAAEVGIVGLVCGSIDDKVLAEFLGYELGIALTGDEEIPFTLIVTEGFGSLPISSRVLEIVGALVGQRCSLNGKTQVRAGAVRPELIISLHGINLLNDTGVESSELTLKEGAQVRLIRVPYFGEFAEVVELPINEEEIPSGAHTRVLRAKLNSGEVVTVPRANVELI